ncbi:carph-isopro domain-containing protein [Afifella aestuarii]|uniref:carph-isopro domain-containing protein n=1 Tax=Afifella aestuarii TaxID=1909496 RepID=UPI000FE41C49|nr:hypothetical protein [Afifella aestuarii]
MKDIASIADLFDALGGSTRVAGLFDPPVPVSTAAEWKRRRSIPVIRWPTLIAAAHAAGLSEVGTDLLVALHAGEVDLSAPTDRAIRIAPEQA